MAVYYAIACGVSWVLWLPLVLGFDGLKVIRAAPSLPVFVSLGTAGTVGGVLCGPSAVGWELAGGATLSVPGGAVALGRPGAAADDFLFLRAIPRTALRRAAAGMEVAPSEFGRIAGADVQLQLTGRPAV